MTSHARIIGWTTLFCIAAGTAEAKEPEHIQLQHVLVGFAGSVPGKPITRSQDQAGQLARELLKKAKKKGVKFEQLVEQNTDDAPPGIYQMSNRGVTPLSPDEYPRERMVPAFGDVGFGLKVGEIGLAPYDPTKSPYGYHLIKRLK